jgi:hypothetical protein
MRGVLTMANADGRRRGSGKKSGNFRNRRDKKLTERAINNTMALLVEARDPDALFLLSGELVKSQEKSKPKKKRR